MNSDHLLLAIRRYNMGWQPALSDKGAGFLGVTPVGVAVLTIRPLESGDAYLVRVQNFTPSDVSANLQFPAVQVEEAYLGSVMGERVCRRKLDPSQRDAADGAV